MFGNRMFGFPFRGGGGVPWRRGGGAGGGGRRPNAMVMMLILQILQMGLEHIPPVTLASVALCIVIYLDLWPGFHALSSATRGDGGTLCFSIVPLLQRPTMAVALRTLKVGIRSHLSHLSDYHLYYNMLSWLYKARDEELRQGSERFLLWTMTAMIGTTLVHSLLSLAIVFGTEPEWFGFAAEWFDPSACVAGWSGIIFALKAAQEVRRRQRGGGGDDEDRDRGGMFGFINPALLPSFLRYGVWLELLWIQLIVPQVSFLGHCSGVLCGIMMVYFDVERILRGPAGVLKSIREGIFAPQPQQRRN